MATITSRSAGETWSAGRDYAAGLHAGDVLALVGDLGAGKTQWVKGLAAGLGSDAEVTSPTFTLIQEYAGGRLPLYHFDCYRLDEPGELLGIGMDEYLDGRGVVVMEWADKFPELLPAGARWIHFHIGEGDHREITW